MSNPEATTDVPVPSESVETSKKEVKKDREKSSRSYRKRHRSRSRSKKRSRSRDRSRRSRSKHKSPKRKRSPSHKRRRSRERRSRSRDRRRKDSRRSKRSRSREKKRKQSSSSSDSGSDSDNDKNSKAEVKSNALLTSANGADNNLTKTSEDTKTADVTNGEIAKTQEVASPVKEESQKDVNGENKSKESNEEKTKKVSKDESKSKSSSGKEKKERRRSRSTEKRKRSRTPSRSSHRRRGRRSRSRERKRSRDRSRRSRSRNRRSRSRKRSTSRSRKRSRSRSKDRGKDKTKTTTDKEKKVSKFSDVDPLSKDFEQAKLEEEMRKRRDRVEMWRKEQKTNLGGEDSKDGDENNDDNEGEDNEINDGKPRKIWSLEDDEDDDEEPVPDPKEGDEEDDDKKEEKETVVKMEVKEEEEDVDPLDAFMMELTKGKDKPIKPKGDKNGPKVSRVSAVAKSSKSKVNKGELMEGNADHMEYSSEEEEESLESAFGKFKNKQQPKKLETTIDHSKINYEPFRKNFYVEVPELAALTTADVDNIRADMEDIKIRGKNCPKPIQSWVQAGVSMKVLNALKKARYEKPTCIQSQAIPAIMGGNDLIGIAKTGSGKTVAFLIPMLRHIMDQRPLENGEGPIAVIMTPTRELALQITKECKRFSKPNKLHVVCVYGGTGISEQIAELKRGAEIIVCTPGRMIDMMSANNGRVTNMRRCSYLVLDEADRMFDMGFEPQVMHIINSCRPDRQTVLFSATFPRQMEALARRILNKPIEVQVGGRSVVCSDVTQEVIVLNEEQKYLKLLELLGAYTEQGAILVFVDKQEKADNLLKDLMGSSYSCMALHGGIDQYDRDSIINDFKSGVNTLLIATSVAARGLDVKNLVLVVNYSCPNHYEDYVHRCGRTGRAGNKGWAITFITPNQARYTGEIMKALELSGAKVPKKLEDLWLQFKNEQQAQGKAVKSNSGFSGRGFKFDETEHVLAKERRQIQKAALGLQDSDDDEPAQDIDDKIESMFNSKKTVKDVATPLGNTSSSGGGAAANVAKLEAAKRLASKISLVKNIGTQDVMQKAATAVMMGNNLQVPKVSAKTIAEQLAEKINQKLNYIPQEKPEEEEDEDENKGVAKRYEEELEINDFPQTCRWKVTSKDTLLQISEYSEAGVTIRGQYFPPGKQVGEEERKLYLAIEATSEIAVQKAKSEITRLIKEELIRLQNSYQPISKGRYKVL
uniref:Probable ATP-dependent RNA helicase DDX46 n=1 Tax=Phallusia mammillata TaxID=59560 RepID=A0A6F9DBA8_9ASCI|nr:probable ATP-dependent RNA helicase DDX46 [Phallusia mammillata]